MRITHISRTWKLVLAFVGVALLAATAFAANSLFAQGRLVPHADPTDSADNDVSIFQSAFVHGSASPWHYHTGDLYGVVRQGTVIEDLGCGKTQEFPAGTALHDPIRTVHQVRNEEAQEAQVSFSQVNHRGDPLIVVVNEPTCSQ
jgi:quercetin dioxygenase-like cupin family protein